MLPPETHPVVALSSCNLCHDPADPVSVCSVALAYKEITYRSSSFPGMMICALIFHFVYYLTMWSHSVFPLLLFDSRDMI